MEAEDKNDGQTKPRIPVAVYLYDRQTSVTDLKLYYIEMMQGLDHYSQINSYIIVIF